MRLERITILAGQAGPVEPGRYCRCLLPRRLRSLVRHLQEQKERQLLDLAAIREPVIAEDVAVIPELLNDLLGLVAHGLHGSEDESESTNHKGRKGHKGSGFTLRDGGRNGNGCLRHGRFPLVHRYLADSPETAGRQSMRERPLHRPDDRRESPGCSSPAIILTDSRSFRPSRSARTRLLETRGGSSATRSMPGTGAEAVRARSGHRRPEGSILGPSQ